MMLRSVLPSKSLYTEEMLLLPLFLLSCEAKNWMFCCGDLGGADSLVLKHTNPN
jgi:hypothetical protein